MFVQVEKYIKQVLKTYGFTRILEDFDLDHAKVLQILEDHGDYPCVRRSYVARRERPFS